MKLARTEGSRYAVTAMKSRFIGGGSTMTPLDRLAVSKTLPVKDSFAREALEQDLGQCGIPKTGLASIKIRLQQLVVRCIL